MEKIRKEFPASHYLGKDIVVVFDPPSAELTITSYSPNTVRRRFEMVVLNGVQGQGLKDMLNEIYKS